MPALSDSGPPRPQKTLYGRRKGPKLSAHQAALIETLLPRLKVPLRENADPKAWFDDPVAEVWLEIGFGAGEHLLWQAAHHPNIGIIGAEPYASGVAKLLSKLDARSHRARSLSPSPAKQSAAGEVASGAQLREPEGVVNTTNAPPPPSRPLGSTPPPLAVRSQEREQKGVSLDPAAQARRGDLLARIRLYTGDARDVIDSLPDASLGRVFLLFPDPWPKKRHHKRRFVQTHSLGALARVMEEGAELRFASDDADYAAWILEHVIAHGAFSWEAERARDWLERSEDWPSTRYEQKALHGIPAFLRFVRQITGDSGLAKKPPQA